VNQPKVKNSSCQDSEKHLRLSTLAWSAAPTKDDYFVRCTSSTVPSLYETHWTLATIWRVNASAPSQYYEKNVWTH